MMFRSVPATLRLAAALIVAGSAFAQPRISNVDLRPASLNGGLEATMVRLVGATSDPAWIGYAVPALAGTQPMCCWNRSRESEACRLEGENQNYGSDSTLAFVARMLVMLRAESGSINRVRVYSDDCQLDAGGLTVHWLGDADPGQSLGYLASLADTNPRGPVMAIAHHDGPNALATLEQLASSDRPTDVRKQALFWMGAMRGEPGLEALRHAMRDGDADLRKDAIFAISINKSAGAIDELVRIAHDDPSAAVRKTAVFWLSQKAGTKAVGAIDRAIEEDPDTEVKTHAVFALSQLPSDEGVPKLIDLARSHNNPAVRKKAIFWLGQSGDQRALEFFESILGR